MLRLGIPKEGKGGSKRQTHKHPLRLPVSFFQPSRTSFTLPHVSLRSALPVLTTLQSSRSFHYTLFLHDLHANSRIPSLNIIYTIIHRG